jgi:hypothetical protein
MCSDKGWEKVEGFIMDERRIYDTLKYGFRGKLASSDESANNSLMFSIAKSVWANVKDWHEHEIGRQVLKKKAESEKGILTDEERSLELTRFLDKKLVSGDLTAAEIAQFKDIFNLRGKDRDITIVVMNYKDEKVKELDDKA